MRVSEITLEYVKEHLRIDNLLADEGTIDDNRLNSHIASAISYVQSSHGYDTLVEMDNNEALTDVVMIIIQDLYDNGSITQQSAISFMTIDRRF